ncbi:MAG: AI-2E family transporter [Methanoregula sp.]|nr:AI-2E family transporter [Methanoregula sp.]
MNRWLLTVALIFVIVIAIKMVSFIVTLILMSLILTLLTLPAIHWLRQKGLTDFQAVLVITCVAILIVLAFIFFTMLSFNSLVADLPQFQDELDTRLRDINAMLNSYGITTTTEGPLSIKLGDIMGFGYSSLVSVAEAVEFIFFVGVTTFFLLLDAPRLRLVMEEWFGRDSETMRQLSCMTGYVIDFIVVRTETNFIHGILFGGFLGIIGVHGAILWGVLTFLLGYIPFIGLVIAAIPAIFFAWLQFGIPGALAVIAAVCVLNLLVENPVYSFLAARKFEMPALIVILSVIFWGWLLGLVGMLFSVPFTLLLLLVFEISDELRWINRALGVHHLFEDKKTCETKS